MTQLEKDRTRYANGYYGDNLATGQEFQDYLAHKLLPRGLILVNFVSRKYQLSHGENALGAEIKRDGKFRETGNLYIEFAEKAHPDNKDFVPSGIMRDDNSWLFIIGDESTVWFFTIKQLQYLKTKYKEVSKTTSKGFLMPVVDADVFCARKLSLDDYPPEWDDV